MVKEKEQKHLRSILFQKTVPHVIKLLEKEGEAARKCINTDCKAQKIENLFIFAQKRNEYRWTWQQTNKIIF